ncbi:MULTISPECIES: lysoplasmalogenase [unclassified Vibrio]|uniref:lysoplasmalogenase n=1 Tax=unclassified Vibrio TaxID=2614977 RepID=UPI0014839E1F|nr:MULTISPECIES: lysoplasmalogenase [unclassified Vibrio]NNN46017.1 lysoplasmalogenase [Vibrio sp. 1-1(7)]NNN73917.1 lysoplasmalogenase [Vibrio sp. 12-2(3-a)]
MWSWISVGLSGFISISAFENHNLKQALLFKNITPVLLLAMLVEQAGDWSSPSIWVAIGLLVAMFADSLHLLGKWPKFCFFAFVAAQLCYSRAFWVQLSGTIVWWLPALLLATSIVAFFLLLPQLDTLIFPVTIMGIILVQLAWASGDVWLKSPSWGSLVGFVGSLIFILSAVLLAIHDYRHALPWGQYWISGSYLLAQALIVASVL